MSPEDARSGELLEREELDEREDQVEIRRQGRQGVRE